LWELTPAEFLDLYEGWKWREERRIKEIQGMHELRMIEFSVLASWLTSPHVKKPLKPTDFYDPNKSKEKKNTTPEESKRIVNDLSKEMGVE
jgi:hypothetical protein